MKEAEFSLSIYKVFMGRVMFMFRSWFITLGCVVAIMQGSPVWAGRMFLEYHGWLTPGYTFYRGAFDLGDLDRDGRAEMVIADDMGAFHVYKYTDEGFELIWISDPVVQDGYIVAVQIIHENVPRVMPQILLLDSSGTLHQFRYTGYLFEETATYENYRVPAGSGRLVVTNLGGNQRTVLIALKASQGTSSQGALDIPGFSGMTLYKLTDAGLVELTDEELRTLKEGEIYMVQELSEDDVRQLQSLTAKIESMFQSSGVDSGRAGVADLDRDAILELLLAVSDPKRPIDRLEIYKEEGGIYTVKVTLELPLMNEMVLGDVDGDSFTEIVGLTFDGEVLVYQWDPLTIRRPDFTEVDWESPHREYNGMIWTSLGAFEALGCSLLEDSVTIRVSRKGRSVVLNRETHTLSCEGEVLLPDVPLEMFEKTPYFPLFLTLDCLGFLYSYYPEDYLVQLDSLS